MNGYCSQYPPSSVFYTYLIFSSIFQKTLLVLRHKIETQNASEFTTSYYNAVV